MYRDLNEAFKGSNSRTYIAWGQDHLIFRMTPLKLTITPATTTADVPSPPLDRPLGPSPQASQVAPLSWAYAINAQLQGSRVNNVPPADQFSKQKGVHTLPEALPIFHRTRNRTSPIKSRLAPRSPRQGWSCLAHHHPQSMPLPVHGVSNPPAYHHSPTQSAGYPNSVV